MAALPLAHIHFGNPFRKREPESAEPPQTGRGAPTASDGRPSLLVRDVMTRHVVTVSEDTRLAAVAALMLKHNTGCVLVLGGNSRLRGMVLESDFAVRDGYLPFSAEPQPQLFGELVSLSRVEDAYERGRWVTAGEVMHISGTTVKPDTPLNGLIRLMMKRRLEYVPVEEAGAIVGVISRHDMLKLMAGAATGEEPVERRW